MKEDEIESFKQDVRLWLEIDNSIRQIQNNLKDRKIEKHAISEKILSFMTMHNIDDLETQIGCIRAVRTEKRNPITHKYILKGIDSYFSDDIVAAQQFRTNIFANRDTVQKVRLQIKKKK